MSVVVIHACERDRVGGVYDVVGGGNSQIPDGHRCWWRNGFGLHLEAPQVWEGA